jgi:hypothetical protein
MPQMTPIVLTDDQANDHSFAPRGKDPQSGVATLVKSTGTPVGDERLTVGRSRTPQGREKISFKLTLPVVSSEVINGVPRPKIERTAYADVTLSFEGTSTTQERANARAMLADLLGTGQDLSSAVIDDLEHLY